MTQGVTLDTGALIAWERNDRRLGDLLKRALERHWQITVPAPVVSQAVRRPDRQARIARLLADTCTQVVPLTGSDAVAVGRLLDVAGTTDVVDAHVVLCAARAGQAIVTSDPDDLRHLDPRAVLVTV